ncbi:hypothetical protein DHW03_16905 [Pedobacter yonginense]|uniref:Tetratricopeptide repeat protein n=1 Tax=Pedobacter yonginense TaxID=651869 RepID=A0A317EK06_9SPHI|nr:tetratricopeptide repeat protein [Pedobacter yonginense]PWS26457.1 hypothetical protein DHW03_16905 [Pedobacter yonginense]
MIEDKILLTARYVEGDMNETERMGFEMRVQYELDLQEHLKDYNEIHQSLKIHLAPNQDDDLFRDTLYAFHKQPFVEEAKVGTLKPLFNWLTGVLATLLLVFLIWAPWRTNLYNQYADGRAMNISPSKGINNNDLENAALYYNQRNFYAAKPLLQKQYQANPKNAMLAYYYGNSLIETNNLDQARAILNPIYAGKSAFKYDAAYAIALSYLKNDRKQDTKIWLQKIPADAVQHKAAVQLINKL